MVSAQCNESSNNVGTASITRIRDAKLEPGPPDILSDKSQRRDVFIYPESAPEPFKVSLLTKVQTLKVFVWPPVLLRCQSRWSRAVFPGAGAGVGAP